MTEGDDYQWFESNGTIKTLSGGQLAGDSTANITYEYSQTNRVQQDFAGLFASGLDIAGLLVFVLGVGVVLAGIAVLGRVS